MLPVFQCIYTIQRTICACICLISIGKLMESETIRKISKMACCNSPGERSKCKTRGEFLNFLNFYSNIVNICGIIIANMHNVCTKSIGCEILRISAEHNTAMQGRARQNL